MSRKKTEGLPPHSIECEMNVIYSMLMENSLIPEICSVVNENDFFRESHGRIFDVIRKAYNSYGQVDRSVVHSMVMDAPSDGGYLEDSSDRKYLLEVIDKGFTSSPSVTYAHIVKEKANLRLIIQACDAAISDAYNEKKSSAEVISSIDSAVSSSVEARSSSRTVHVSESVNQAIARMHSRAGTITGVSTGISSLDVEIDGINNSQMIIVAGRPSMGKSSLASKIVMEVAFNTGKPALIFSAEMNASELASRMLSTCSKMPLDVLRNQNFATASQKAAIAAAHSRLSSSEIYINDSGDISPEQIFNISYSYKRKKDLGIVVVDYLQILNMAQKNERWTNNEEKIAGATKTLRLISRKLEIPVVVLSQINRESEKNESKRPMLSNLRGSGTIENEAHLVIIIHRPEYYDPSEKPGIAELIIAKNRNGKTGSVDVSWKGDTFDFSDLVPPLSSFGAAGGSNGSASTQNSQNKKSNGFNKAVVDNDYVDSDDQWEYS